MTERLSISLEAKHIRAVERYGRQIGVRAFSTALQALIHQFEMLQKANTAEDTPSEYPNKQTEQ